MEESIGLIITPTFQSARALVSSFYYGVQEAINKSDKGLNIRKLKIKNETTFEFVADVFGEEVKYIYMFKSIRSGHIYGIHFSGINITPTVLKSTSIKDIGKILMEVKPSMISIKYDPFTPLDCLLPGFIR